MNRYFFSIEVFPYIIYIAADLYHIKIIVFFLRGHEYIFRVLLRFRWYTLEWNRLVEGAAQVVPVALLVRAVHGIVRVLFVIARANIDFSGV